MKRVFAILLAAMLLLTLAACQEEQPGTNGASTPSAGSNPTSPKGQTTLEIITAAAEKTRNAKSFVLRYGTKREYQGESFEEPTTVQVSIDDQGKLTALSSQWHYNMDYPQYPEGVESILYIKDNIAYEQDYYRSPVGYYKHISSTPFTLDMLTGDIAELNPPNFLAAFCAAKLETVVTETGDTRYQPVGLSVEQIYELLVGEPWPEGEEFTMNGMPVEKIDLAVDITEDGYLSGFSYAFHVYLAEEDARATMEIFIEVKQHNEALNIQEPAFVAEHESNQTWEEYHIYEDGYEAIYSKIKDYYGEFVEEGQYYYQFEGLCPESDDFQAVPVYKVLPEIDGIPVANVRDVSAVWSPDFFIEKLVLPEGVSYRGETLENTELFFESEKADLKNEFNVMGEEAEYEYWPYVKAAYYAGEWEYVDGVPTPKA